MLELLIVIKIILFLCFLQVDHLYLMLHVERVHDLGSFDHHDTLSLFLATSPDVSELLFRLKLKLSLLDEDLLGTRKDLVQFVIRDLTVRLKVLDHFLGI